MTKTEFLAASLPLPYELKIMVLYFENGLEVSRKIKPLTGYTIEKSVAGGYFAKVGYFRDEEFRSGENILPIIRPLDSLTTECVQADYNDGKPFVPIIELLEIELEKSVCHKYWKPIAAHIEWKAVKWKAVNRTSCFGYSKGGAFFHTECGEYQYLYNYEKLFQQLLKWHFWPNMPENEEVVYVTNEFNPYK